MRREKSDQRRPTRFTGPPRFVGVPTRPTPGVATARATGRGRSTTPALTVQPAGYSTYWQYTTALAGSVVAAMKPAISNADNAIESFMMVSLGETLQTQSFQGTIWSSTARLTGASSAGLIQIKWRKLPHESYFGHPRFS
jgi:hypothetical protein